jgi:hypothetical protein
MDWKALVSDKCTRWDISPTPPGARVAVEPGRIRLVVGSFEAECTADGFGSVRIDGQEQRWAKGFTVRVVAGELARVRIDYVPIGDNGRADPLADDQRAEASPTA